MGLPVNQCRDAAIAVCSTAGVDLEDFVIARAGRREIVKVTVDQDGGVDLDLIAEISRQISEALDVIVESDDSPFVLEVSSPGVDRPLTDERHWRRAIGHLVKLEASSTELPLTLRVNGVENGRITLTNENGETIHLSLADVHNAVVQVEFNRGE
jgi:ribosome maturation factor RimP